MNFREKRRRSAITLELTPLIDVVFQLLVFFFLTSAFVRNPSIDINLPAVSETKVPTERKDVRIGVARDGALQVDGAPVDVPGLRARLEERFASEPDTLILIEADRAALHGRVFEIIDMAKSIGFRRLGLAGEPKR